VSEQAEDGLPRLAALRGRHPRLIDAAIVVALVVLSTVPRHARDQGGLAVAFSIALALPLLWRREHPIAVFGAVATLALAQWFADIRAFGDIALLVALYSVALTQPLRRTLAAGAVLEAGVVLATARWGGGEALKLLIGLSGLATAAGVLGTSARNRRAFLLALEERAARLEEERDQQGRLATAAERSRIAREMHDIVAHNLSVMIALADGAGYAVRNAPDRAEAALATASRTGREALTEMRRLLGVLRDEPAAAARAPQPGIVEIDALVEQVRAAGVPVRYAMAGRPGDLPQGLQLAAYRIVQEALTNTLKHAGPDAHAAVTLSCAADSLEVEVRNSGRPAEGPAEEGVGLRGMRERAAVYDGVVDAGPLPAGGWCVHTRLRLRPIPAATAVPV
jgi:signal transduction histidine kinase